MDRAATTVLVAIKRRRGASVGSFIRRDRGDATLVSRAARGVFFGGCVIWCVGCADHLFCVARDYGRTVASFAVCGAGGWLCGRTIWPGACDCSMDSAAIPHPSQNDRLFTGCGGKGFAISGGVADAAVSPGFWLDLEAKEGLAVSASKKT